VIGYAFQVFIHLDDHDDQAPNHGPRVKLAQWSARTARLWSGHSIDPGSCVLDHLIEHVWVFSKRPRMQAGDHVFHQTGVLTVNCGFIP